MNKIIEAALRGDGTVPPGVQGAQPVSVLTFDYDLAAAYLTALTGSVDTVMDWRCLSDTGPSAKGKVFRGTLAQAWEWLCRWNAAGYGCFLTVNATDGQGRSKGNITAVRAVWADLDGIDARQQYEAAAAWSPAPSFAVQTSPERWHIYWLLAPGCPLDMAESLNRRLRTRFNADQSATDLARVLRVPGSYHLKADPALVTCHSLAGFGQPVDWKVLDTALADQPDHSGKGERHPLGDATLAAPSLKLAAMAMNLIDPNDLSFADWIKVLAALKQSLWSHMTPDAVTTMLLQWCSRYEADDPADNRKQIASIRRTSAGWPSLVKLVPELGAEAAFPQKVLISSTAPQTAAVATYDLPTGASTTGAPSHLDVVRQCDDWRLPIAHDTFADRLMVTGVMPGERAERGGIYPRPLQDRDYTIVRLQFNGLGLKPGSEALREGVNFYASTNPYNPVTDWLDSLTWDGEQRLDHWLSRYVGVEPGPWATLAGSKFLVAMVARAMQPGCKVDTSLVIDGVQGAGKSTALRILAGDAHFGDQLPNVRDKEGLQYMQGLWLVEIAELAAIRKADLEDVRKFITAQIDRYRPPYGHQPVDRPRRCVFAATTNESAYLRDHKGDRRFWPVTAGAIDTEGLAANREQMFAEALHRYRAGEAWHLSSAEEAIARVEQAKRRKVSEWFGTVAAVCAEAEAEAELVKQRVTMTQVFMRANLNIGELNNPRYTVPIAGDLAALGWKRDRTTAARFYVKDDA